MLVTNQKQALVWVQVWVPRSCIKNGSRVRHESRSCIKNGSRHEYRSCIKRMGPDMSPGLVLRMGPDMSPGLVLRMGPESRHESRSCIKNGSLLAHYTNKCWRMDGTGRIILQRDSSSFYCTENVAVNLTFTN